MRLPFIPREEAFFDFFVEDAQNVLTAARLLVEFFESYDQRERIGSQLIDLEHKGDAISHDIGQRLEKTFVTPFDREDIQELISRLELAVGQIFPRDSANSTTITTMIQTLNGLRSLLGLVRPH